MAVAKRRTVLQGVGAAGAAALAGCGSDEPSDPTGHHTPGDTGESQTESPAGDDAALAGLGDVPVGGGVVLGEQDVVLTQPTEGEVKGFQGTCTHKGCKLASVTDNTINCKCHGSKFDATDGSVKQGPATTALPEVKVRVEGDEVFRA